MDTIHERGLVATCSMVDLEVLYSCRSPSEYDAVWSERAGLERLDIHQPDWDRALQVQRELAVASRHRYPRPAHRRCRGAARGHRAALRPRLRPDRGGNWATRAMDRPGRRGPMTDYPIGGIWDSESG